MLGLGCLVRLAMQANERQVLSACAKAVRPAPFISHLWLESYLRTIRLKRKNFEKGELFDRTPNC